MPPFFKPGHPKYGGRKKGSKNKIKMAPIEESLVLAGFDIGKEIAKLYAAMGDTSAVHPIKARLLELASKYVQPLPKPVYVPVESPVVALTDEELLDSLEAPETTDPS